MELRERALETVLAEKGCVDPAAHDAPVDAYQTKVGARDGAKVVARAWTDPACPRRVPKPQPRRRPWNG